MSDSEFMLPLTSNQEKEHLNSHTALIYHPDMSFVTTPGPLVSCIMPVRGRRDILPLAIRSYLGQDYPYRELIVIVDGPDTLWDIFQPIPNCTHCYSGDPMTVGAKRNLAVQLASGSFIASCDSDDWFDPSRIRHQLNLLLRARNRSSCGFNRIHFYDLDSAQACRYQYSHYVCGGSILCRRDWLLKHPFPDKSVGEDEDIAIRHMAETVSVGGLGMMVALLHGDSVSSREQSRRNPRYFPKVDHRELPEGFWTAIHDLEKRNALLDSCQQVQ